MWGGKSNQQWVAQYATSHQHPMNRACHTFGIPIIVVSFAPFVASVFIQGPLKWALVFFLVGWTLQFIGHAFAGKAPEFFHDWRFLFVGLRWWTAKMRGKA